jgi:hypothetical protein
VYICGGGGGGGSGGGGSGGGGGAYLALSWIVITNEPFGFAM